MTILQQTVSRHNDQQIHCHEWFVQNHADRVVLIYPTWAGITDFERTVAGRLNASGLEAVIVDFYGNTNDLSSVEGRYSAMQGYTRDISDMSHHLYVLNDWIRNQVGNRNSQTPRTFSILGFCLGGMCALMSGQSQQGLMNAISFHGLLSFPKSTPPADPSTRFMILNGLSDPMVSKTDVQETQVYFETHQQTLCFINFSCALHSFAIPSADDPDIGVQYNHEVAERSWRYALDFLTE